MTTFLFIFSLFLGAGVLIHQHRCFERERCEVAIEVCALLETLEREVASLSTHPVFSGLEERCPYLSSRGVIDALSVAKDTGVCMCEALPNLPLSQTATELLVGYFTTFGRGERYREHEQLVQLLERMRDLCEQQKSEAASRSRAFEVLVACCALCAAIVVI